MLTDFLSPGNLHMDGLTEGHWQTAMFTLLVNPFGVNATLTLPMIIMPETRGSATADEPRDALRQLKYYGSFLTELLTRSSANPEEPCE